MSRSHPTVLIVDDEPLFRSSVADALVALGSDYKVLEAKDGREALRRFDREARIDAIVTDLRMPRMGGLELVLELRERKFNGVLIVVTAHGDAELERQLQAEGAFRYFEKPVDLGDLVETVRAAVESDHSRVTGVTMSGFAQLLQVERKTCLLQVRTESNSGDLLFRKGQLVDARVGELRGEEAALAIFSWEAEAQLDLLVGYVSDERTIREPLELLLLESMRRRDEESAAALFAEGALAPELTEPDAPSPAASDGNIQQILDSALAIDGALGVALVDFASGEIIGQAGGGEAIDLDLAGTGNSKVVSAKLSVMDRLGLDDSIEDILITLGSQYHLIRPLTVAPDWFLYLALRRGKGSLAMARYQLAALERALEL